MKNCSRCGGCCKPLWSKPPFGGHYRRPAWRWRRQRRVTMDAHSRRQNRQGVIAVALALVLAVGMCGGLAVAPQRVAAAGMIPASGGGCSTASFMQVAGSPFGAGTEPRSVAVGDFNGDGKPDLAVANFGSNNVTILLGDGKGGFSPAAGSPV